MTVILACGARQLRSARPFAVTSLSRNLREQGANRCTPCAVRDESADVFVIRTLHDEHLGACEVGGDEVAVAHRRAVVERSGDDQRGNIARQVASTVASARLGMSSIRAERSRRGCDAVEVGE